MKSMCSLCTLSRSKIMFTIILIHLAISFQKSHFSRQNQNQLQNLQFFFDLLARNSTLFCVFVSKILIIFVR